MSNKIKQIKTRTRRHQRRRRHDGPNFIKLFRYVLDSPAYVSLSAWAKAGLVEITRGYNGSNNGNIRLSVRELAKRIGCARDTAWRALQELVDKGFIEPVIKGAFHIKYSRATVWRLNDRHCDITGAQSQAFLKWTASPITTPRKKQSNPKTEALKEVAQI